MDVKKVDITICLGSSCFARGNKQLVSVVKQYLVDHNLDEQVFFHGNHCFDKCNEGPVIKINDKLYKGVNEKKVTDILDKHFYKI